MKNKHLRNLTPGHYGLLIVGSLLLSSLLTGCQDEVNAPAVPGVVTVTKGLLSPLGVDTDAGSRVWVAEAGTGKNDGRVSVIGSRRQD